MHVFDAIFSLTCTTKQVYLRNKLTRICLRRHGCVMFKLAAFTVMISSRKRAFKII